MPKNAKTRKCYIKRSNATRKLAAQRRKISEDILTLNEKVHQLLLDTMKGTFEKVKQDKTMAKSKMGKLMLKIADADKFAKLMLFGSLINQQIKHLPPMSVEQEKHMIENLKLSLTSAHESLQKIKKVKNKGVNPVHYENPYSLRPTQMPNLYVGTGACAWEAENVDALYTKRQKAIKAYYDMVAKNTEFVKKIHSGAEAAMFAAVDRSMMIMKTLPPGPNKESEQERIEYLELATEFVEDVIQMIKVLMQELKKLISQMKKEMAKVKK